MAINYTEERLLHDVQTRPHISMLVERCKREFSIHGKRVVELGCGLGQCLRSFIADCTVVGVDGLEAVSTSPDRFVENIITCNLNGPLPFGDGSFDVVLCLDVLEHIENVQTAVAEAYRILAPGGLFIMNVPNHFTLKGRIRLLLSGNVDTHKYFPDAPLWAYPHLRFFNHRAVMAMLKANKFDLLEDWSSKIYDFPFMNNLKNPSNVVGMFCARLSPALFGAGFFIIARK